MSRVLIVDDVHDNVKLLSYELTDLGYSVRTAFSGAQALRSMAESAPDCVLLDIMMPEMDGYEACRLIKANPAWRGIPVIMVSARDGDDDVIEGLSNGADDYVTKPFNVRIVDARVQAALRTKRANDVVAEMNLRLNEARLEAEKASRAKSEFLARMSHEIRTPMTAILGFAELLLEGPLPADHIATLTTVRRNGEYLLALINDILDLSKIEAGELRLERIPCPLPSIVRDVIGLMRQRAEARRISLRLVVEGLVPDLVLLDPTRLRQVLINLVGNAIKFTEAGEVQLKLSASDANLGQAWLRFEVVDTGVGMTPEHIHKIFEPFRQADDSTTRRFGGTGLGLTISKQIVEAMGGSISVHSTPGCGSTFTITLAVAPVAEATHLAASHIAWSCDATKEVSIVHPDALLTGRVLVAEDGLDNQRLLRVLLTKAGIDVMVVENGRLAMEAALEALRNNVPFNVVLMDVQMPEVDGVTATRQLRQAGYFQPIVALTANAMNSDRMACLNAGCDDFLSKPIQFSRLRDVLRRYCQERPRNSGEETCGQNDRLVAK